MLKHIYAGRDITQTEQLEYSLKQLLPYTNLLGIEQAVEILAGAIQQQQKIMIVADFDADGATSCAMMLRALRMMGAEYVDYLVPNRFSYGYGLTPEIVALALERTPDIIVTVDNGISSVEGVAAAKQAGVRVVVTDHHLPGAVLPNADAIVNPNQVGDEFPAKSTAGVGVAFYVMLALRAELREQKYFEANSITDPNLANLLDLVALGTVADVVPLEHNNRILVAQGLARVRKGQCCAGITALLHVAKRNQAQCVASDFGFTVGPRLNAAGRLEDMSLGIECLLTDDPVKAAKLASELDNLNKQRRHIETDMRQQAFIILEKLELGDELPVGVCLFDKNWHQGVIGILASRVKEQLYRPVIAFAPGEEAGTIKGSARSIPGLHIRDVLDAVAAKHPELISKFGGHAMAAGLSLPRENFQLFSQAFDQQVRALLSDDDLEGLILSDGELTEKELSLEFAEQLRNAGPWGQGFPEPIFDGEFEIVSKKILAEKHLKMMLRLPNDSGCIDAIAFNITDEDWPAGTSRVKLAYRLDVNEFQGRKTAQLMVEQVELY
ncbi:MAG: single-stranded-DNA-specific exonuclease RecJ [Sulfuriflexus sp.]|nr:single-stranded-DNA-specific exonuclease RecJ [Sulfuriflexus sp.]